jgi:hypothetical protein
LFDKKRQLIFSGCEQGPSDLRRLRLPEGLPDRAIPERHPGSPDPGGNQSGDEDARCKKNPSLVITDRSKRLTLINQENWS